MPAPAGRKEQRYDRVSRSSECNESGARRASHRDAGAVWHRLCALLLVFTAITVAAAYIDLGIFNPVVALAIACTKAVIVILFFMHVKYQSKLVKMTVLAGFFTFLVLITMTLTDYISRAWGLW